MSPSPPESTSSSDPRDVTILGSTGSVGTQAIDVVRRNPDRFRVGGLSAGGAQLPLLAQQALDLGVEVVGIATPGVDGEFLDVLRAEATSRGLRPGDYPEPRIVTGPDAASEVASSPGELVLNGISGSIGLAPTLAALDAGRILALANKESLIVGGPLVKARAKPGQIVPVDSEHSALAQCLRGGTPGEVRRLVLTASGGPFRGWSAADLAGVTPAQALAHPTWSMGPLISVNSATLVNKGLEVIEAALLFDIGLDRIEVVVHPQSIVHSMVEFTDGSTLAQASPPDMRIPIALGMGWPDRCPDAAPACDWTKSSTWEFFPLDETAFPAVSLARQAGEAGGTAPAVFNAANEECVAAFLAGGLPFPGILEIVAQVLGEHSSSNLEASLTLADVLDADSAARARARELLEGRT